MIEMSVVVKSKTRRERSYCIFIVVVALMASMVYRPSFHLKCSSSFNRVV